MLEVVKHTRFAIEQFGGFGALNHRGKLFEHAVFAVAVDIFCEVSAPEAAAAQFADDAVAFFES